jgi:membrane-associated phospholipid phosphatase
MSDRFEQPHDISLVRAIHTAVKGRARYKIDGLYQNKSLKQYLEFRLSKEEAIASVKANYLTGNVLAIFRPDISPNAIALLLQNLVLDYRKQTKTLPVKTIKQKQLERSGSQIILASSVVGTLVLSTLLLHHPGLDTAILLAIQKLHSPLLDRIMLGITALGDPIVLLPLCLGWGMGALFYRRRSQATTLGIITVGAIGLNCWLKLLFGRARPALWDRLIHVGLHSFPSGHAMVSIATYGFIGYSLANQFPQRQRQIFALTAILIGAIGFSRLYLGVHWLTDVTAGYAVGLVWLIACILSSQPSLASTWQEEPTRAIAPSLI